MSGGITDAADNGSKKKRLPFYTEVAQGATAGELRESLKDIPDDAEVTFVDSYEENVTWDSATVTAGIGFKWAADVSEVQA